MTQNSQNNCFVISAFKKGDENAFKTIYNDYKKPLSAFINSYTKNQAQTDDIIQETFIKLWRVRNSLNENKSIVSFLYKIAYNEFIDNYRKVKREESKLDGWKYKQLMEIVDVDDDVRKQKITLLLKAIDKLPPRCKAIFMMSKFEQLKYVEIAENLDISVKTVESQMGKAFAIIREEFKGKGFFNLFLCFIKNKVLNVTY